MTFKNKNPHHDWISTYILYKILLERNTSGRSNDDNFDVMNQINNFTQLDTRLIFKSWRKWGSIIRISAEISKVEYTRSLWQNIKQEETKLTSNVINHIIHYSMLA